MTTPPPTDYVVGLAFDTDGRVALIRKNRPAWQAGRLNGIGGHVEPSEIPTATMEREFHEETGSNLTGWDLFVVMGLPDARIYFYRVRNLSPGVLDGLRTTTDEPIEVHQVADVLDAFAWDHETAVDHHEHRAIPNLSWLLPLAAYAGDRYDVIHVQAHVAEVIEPLPGCPSCDHDLASPGVRGHVCYTYAEWYARQAESRARQTSAAAQ